jgi:hypothetical protein
MALKPLLEFPNWDFLKNKVRKSDIFRRPKSDRQFTTFYQQITTTSPRFTIQKTQKNSKPPCKNAPSTTQNFFRQSNLAPQRLPSEVVQRVGEEGEHEDADPVMVEWVVVAEAGDGAIGGGFVELDADAEESDDAACGDQA